MCEPALLPEEQEGGSRGINYSYYAETFVLMCTIEEAERTDMQQVHNGSRKYKNKHLNASGVPITIVKLIELTERGWLL